MSWNEIRKKLNIGTIGLWVIFGIVIVVMIALIVGEVFPPYDFWIPIIPIGVVLVLAIAATVVDTYSERKRKVGIVGVWAVFFITGIVMAALMIGDIFDPDVYWIPLIVVGSLFILAIIPTILEYTAGEVKFCPKFRKIFEKKWDFCQECGTRILMKCPSCGIKVKGNPKFCIKCGTNLSEIEVIQTSSPPIKFKAEGYTELCNQCGAPAKPEAKYCVFCGVSQ
ncbi:MAG: zinc ribbon domain-containing protein [Candidatus Lokiarchaeota archaeon]|nr:zinc ribbon domain-containing protein [Candidatus Lokiarchaeota archaeon]